MKVLRLKFLLYYTIKTFPTYSIYIHLLAFPFCRVKLQKKRQKKQFSARYSLLFFCCIAVFCVNGRYYCKQARALPHRFVTPLSQNGLVQLGHGSAVRRSTCSRLVPDYKARIYMRGVLWIVGSRAPLFSVRFNSYCAGNRSSRKSGTTSNTSTRACTCKTSKLVGIRLNYLVFTAPASFTRDFMCVGYVRQWCVIFRNW